MKVVKTVGLIGRPNSGKTTLFNILTNSSKKTANYGGVTVSSSKQALKLEFHRKTQIIDLPGIYSLQPNSVDEQITINALHDHKIKLDLILAVIDIHNLQLGLNLVVALKKIGIPMIVVLNMVDSEQDSHKYNIPLLCNLIKLPVIITSAVNGSGSKELLSAIDQNLHFRRVNNNLIEDNNSLEDFKLVQEIINKVTQYNIPSKSFLLSQKIDKILIHPIWGSIILILILLLSFQALFNFGNIPHDSLQDLVFRVQKIVLSINPGSLMINLLANGIISGVGAIFVFLPQIVLFSVFIIIFEETGYMARIAFLMDNIMACVGLNGRSFLPLLSSFACAIPGIISTRIIPNRRDRIITILIAPLIPCSARLPVYTLLISAFIPYRIFYGFSVQALFMCVLYIIGILFALLGAFLIQRFFSKKSVYHPPILELPVYRIPNFRNIIANIYEVIVDFISQAGSIILATMVVVWFLSSYPSAPSGVAAGDAINYSYLAIVGKFLLPIFKPIGFNWKIVVALIPGMLAREIVLAVLASVFAVETSSFWLIDGGGVHANLAHILAQDWTLATGASLITWFIFAPQCVSTLTVAKQETQSWFWPAFMFVYQFCLAYTTSFIVFHIINKL
jgi:ferrous iron transport protein B